MRFGLKALNYLNRQPSLARVAVVSFKSRPCQRAGIFLVLDNTYNAHYCYKQKGGAVLRYREIVKQLKADGWYEVGAVGSHHHFKHPTKPGKITVPDHGGRDLHPDIVKSIKNQAGI